MSSPRARLEGFVIFGHRGAAGRAPENTLAGFDAGIADGAAWLELDVQAHPEALLVFHDDQLARTTNGLGRLLDTPLAVLRGLDAGEGQRIPTLEETLAHCQGRCGLNIELKAGPEVGMRTAEVLRQACDDGWCGADLLVSSFQHDALAQFRAAAPAIPVAPLFDRTADGALAVAAQLDATAVHLGLAAVDAGVVNALKAAGLRVHVYTVNDPQHAAALMDMGVDGIFTDAPGRLTLSLARNIQAVQ